MARLKVLLRGALISEVVLQNEKEYIGGRKEGSDIWLQAEKGISREHFKLKFSDGHWNIQAVSRFGDIFSMGQKIEQATLEHGQSFQIPPYEFQLLEVPDSDVASGKSSSPEPINENEKTVIGVSPQVPYIKVVNSNGDVREMLRLEVGEVWVAGRDPSCQIIIPDQRVSRRQFEIHKMNGSYTIIDLASVNGTFLNGSPVSSTDPQSLKSGDAITVLDNTMYFELHDPNFKYKVEKIEVPPLQYEQVENTYNAPLEQPQYGAAPSYQPLPVEVPLIQQDQINPQLNTGGGPFTGVPPNFDPNQFYTFVPPQNQTPPPKKKLSPVMMAVIALVVGGGLFYYLDDSGSVLKDGGSASNPADPLLKLTPEQRTQVRELYSLAEQMLTQEKYDLALERLAKIHELVKEGYLDSYELKSRAESALLVKAQAEKDAELERIAEENKKKIAEITLKCETLLTENVSMDQMQECLAPMSQIDPSAPEYVRLMAEAERLQKVRELKEAQVKSIQNQIQELENIFKQAEKNQAEGFAFKAMGLYRNVMGSELPDPKKLKQKAQERVAFIEQKISDKTSKSVGVADGFAQEGKLKDAIETLRESLVYDPLNRKLKEKMEFYREDLKRQTRLLYQEAIIDESYGIVDSTETKQGAKDKWKKIVDIDLDDGEYYRKAVIKLRRYGVL